MIVHPEIRRELGRQREAMLLAEAHRRPSTIIASIKRLLARAHPIRSVDSPTGELALEKEH